MLSLTHSYPQANYHSYQSGLPLSRKPARDSIITWGKICKNYSTKRRDVKDIATGILRIVEIQKKMTNTEDYPKYEEEGRENTDPASK